jgi:hypothetical protein
MIYLDPRGLRKYDHAKLHQFSHVQEQGRAPATSSIPRIEGAAREARLRQHLRDALHLGHDGQAQGRGAVEPQHHRDRAASSNSTSCARRRGPGLSADGLGGRFHLLDRAGLLDRLLRELPRKRRHDDDRPARDRADLLLCPAAGVRDAADQRDDPDGGRRPVQEVAVRRTSWSMRARSARNPADGKPVGAGTG